jgi:hypothetical protein
MFLTLILDIAALIQFTFSTIFSLPESVVLARLEPLTSGLGGECSTTELPQLTF